VSPALITAICTGAVSVIGAVAALVKVITHQNDPDAHSGQARP
jgi:hypothetical protein